jgi:hypothetical protein
LPVRFQNNKNLASIQYLQRFWRWEAHKTFGEISPVELRFILKWRKKNISGKRDFAKACDFPYNKN